MVNRHSIEKKNNLRITRDSVCIALGSDSPLTGLLQVSQQVESTRRLVLSIPCRHVCTRFSLVYSNRLAAPPGSPQTLVSSLCLCSGCPPLWHHLWLGPVWHLYSMLCPPAKGTAAWDQLWESKTWFCFLVLLSLVECANCVLSSCISAPLGVMTLGVVAF